MVQYSLSMKLRVLRAERGLTLREAEELTGVSRETLGELEKGQRHPHDVTLAKLAKGYGVPVAELLEAREAAGKAEAPEAEAGQQDEYEQVREVARSRGEDPFNQALVARYLRLPPDELIKELVQAGNELYNAGERITQLEQCVAKLLKEREAEGKADLFENVYEEERWALIVRVSELSERNAELEVEVARLRKRIEELTELTQALREARGARNR